MRLKNNFELRQLSPKTYILEMVDYSGGDFNKIVTFNSSAAFLWNSLSSKEFSTLDVANLLKEKYGIDEDIAIADATSLLDTWNKNSLIEI